MRSVSEIYDGLCSEFAAVSGIAVNKGGDMSLRLYAVAAEIFSLEAQADFVKRQSFPQTATGEYLDRHAEVRGITRGEAQKASGTLKFYINEAAASDIAVPAGTRCLSASETVFVTTAAGAIAAGSTYCEAAAEAASAGESGNVPAGSIAFMTLAPAGVAGVINEAAFLGGSDGETDDELRQRVTASYRRLPNGANRAYYESKALSIPQVAAVTVLPKNRGIGTVDIVFSTASGIPDAALVARVQSEMDAEREICVDIDVCAPTAVTVNVEAAISVSDGYDFQAVKVAAESAISGYFDGKLLSTDIFRARLGAILMAVEGLENYSLTLPAADVAVGDTFLPVLGTLNISQAV